MAWLVCLIYSCFGHFNDFNIAYDGIDHIWKNLT